MMNLSPHNELGGVSQQTHHAEAARPSALTTAPLVLLSFAARCGNEASAEVIANRASERRAR